MDATLYYIYDPMCSWCWGFRQTWDALRERLQGRVAIRYVLGGLAPESHEPMSEEMQASLQQTWRRVHELTGAPFNFAFWRNNTPYRSTYPACKAVLVARGYGLERQMYERIQHYYYAEAGNPSVYDNLVQLAVELGLDADAFAVEMHSEVINQALLAEVQYAEALGAQGFPSLVLGHNGALDYIPLDYNDVEKNLQLILAALQA